MPSSPARRQRRQDAAEDGTIIEVEAPETTMGRPTKHEAMVKQVEADEEYPIEALELPDHR